MRKTDTTTIAAAMRILAGSIESDDGVANAAIFEAAERLEELEGYRKSFVVTVGELSQRVTSLLDERDELAAQVELLRHALVVARPTVHAAYKQGSAPYSTLTIIDETIVASYDFPIRKDVAYVCFINEHDGDK